MTTKEKLISVIEALRDSGLSEKNYQSFIEHIDLYGKEVAEKVKGKFMEVFRDNAYSDYEDTKKELESIQFKDIEK